MKRMIRIGLLISCLLGIVLSTSCDKDSNQLKNQEKEEKANHDIIGKWGVAKIGIGSQVIDFSSREQAQSAIESLLTTFLSKYTSQLPPHAVKQLKGSINETVGVLRKISYEIKEDGTFSIDLSLMAVTGTWVREGNNLLLRVDPKWIGQVMDENPVLQIESGELVYRIDLGKMFDLSISHLKKERPGETPEEAKIRKESIERLETMAGIAKLIPLSLILKRA